MKVVVMMMINVTIKCHHIVFSVINFNNNKSSVTKANGEIVVP
jgi:hypothetical protein